MRIVLLLLVFFHVVNVHAEEADSTAIFSGIEEIVVTATKTATQLEKSTVPLSQIVQKYIKATGSIKLADLLQEQNGIQLSSFLGTGVQLQGMSADYTLILLNGEPIVGKTAGVVDLSRIVVSNIKKVEIVKGPVSCLYGSDAIGGVINIITEDVGMLKNSVEYSLQYKSPVPERDGMSHAHTYITYRHRLLLRSLHRGKIRVTPRPGCLVINERIQLPQIPGPAPPHAGKNEPPPGWRAAVTCVFGSNPSPSIDGYLRRLSGGAD